MDEDETLISVGKVVRPHGLKGEVKVEPLTDWPERFEVYRSLYLEGEKGGWVDVERGRVQGRHVILKLQGVDDREGAGALREVVLKIRRRECPPLEEGSYYIFDLVGSTVRTVEGEAIGTVVDVLRMPAQDVFVVDMEGREVLIPAVKAFIKDVDVENKRVVVELIEGLLD